MTQPRTWIEPPAPPAPPYHFLLVGIVCLLLTGCVTVALDCPKVATPGAVAARSRRLPPGRAGGCFSSRPCSTAT